MKAPILIRDVEAEFNEAIDLMNKFDQDQGIRDIEATIHHAQIAIGNHNVGCVGYCLGGRLAFMTAARTDIRASVGYYGVGIDGLLGEKGAIAHEVMLHIPTADGFVPPEAQAVMHAGLDDHPKVTLHDYEGLDHGFAAQFGNRRDEKAANLADSRTEAFFAGASLVSAAANLKVWHDHMASKSEDGLSNQIADNAVFHSPVVHTPQAGKPLVMAYLSAADVVLGNDSFRYVREIVDEEKNMAMLEFELELDGIHVNGVDIITWNDAGQIQDFKVMVRPLKAINKIWEEMGKMLEKMKG